ncbi:MAG: aldo/keto reductase [Thermoguttaceae bacterium]
MSRNQQSPLSRRGFVRQTGLLAGGIVLGAGLPPLPGAEPASASPAGPLPQRVLGRTGVSVTTFTLGTAPCGSAEGVSPREIADIVNVALDEGVNSIDTAPAYVKAEEGVGLGLGKRRSGVFLATKVAADTIEDAEKSLAKSLRLLKTDYLDLVYYHSLGNRKIQGAREAEGVFTWLAKQKKAGKARFLGVSGHNLPGRFPAFLESGEVDVLLTIVNFVDRHTYRFEEDVLPIASKHKIGIVAMKVFGGARQKSGGYKNPKSPPQMDPKHLELAVRYSLSTPGVTTLNLGVQNADQVRKNVQMLKTFQPLPPDEYQAAIALGKPLASQWGEHFGPLREASA